MKLKELLLILVASVLIYSLLWSVDYEPISKETKDAYSQDSIKYYHP